ncbi:hypothetical protein [Amycolatopsis magusensis]|uniref:hypothetical protein n=1 Tax=Amycolatopsis magusensis TaxID=882444 RepID=UPI0037890513
MTIDTPSPDTRLRHCVVEAEKALSRIDDRLRQLRRVEITQEVRSVFPGATVLLVEVDMTDIGTDVALRQVLSDAAGDDFGPGADEYFPCAVTGEGRIQRLEEQIRPMLGELIEDEHPEDVWPTVGDRLYRVPLVTPAEEERILAFRYPGIEVVVYCEPGGGPIITEVFADGEAHNASVTTIDPRPGHTRESWNEQEEVAVSDASETAAACIRAFFREAALTTWID